MDTLVMVLIILASFNFILKQTFCKWYWIAFISIACTLFVGTLWPLAVTQSKSQIAMWLADSALMLDIAIVLTIDVAMQIAFCIIAAKVKTEGKLPKKQIWIYRFLRWFPGILILPILFFLLVASIFAFPEYDFNKVAWVCAFAVGIMIPMGIIVLIWLFPQKEMRLELLFLTNALIAILGIIATVNGRTAVEGTAQINWSALAGLLLLVIAGTVTGAVIWCIKIRKQIKNL